MAISMKWTHVCDICGNTKTNELKDFIVNAQFPNAPVLHHPDFGLLGISYLCFTCLSESRAFASSKLKERKNEHPVDAERVSDEEGC